MELRDCKWCILWRVTEILPLGSLVSKCHVVSQCVHKCNLIYTHNKVWPFLSRFSWNLQIFNSTVSRFLILNFAQIWQQMCKVWTQIHWHSEVKCDFHCYNFQETYNYTINSVDISYIEFDPQWKKNVANMGNKSSFNVWVAQSKKEHRSVQCWNKCSITMVPLHLSVAHTYF